MPPGSKHLPLLNLEPVCRRSYRAWVLDARSRKAVPLENWQSKAPAAGLPRLTAVGELVDGKLAGRKPGEVVENRLFDAAYYPTARNRFGFHDPAKDVSGGPLAYTVVGWYSNPADDPLYAAGNDAARRALAEAAGWELPWVCRPVFATPLRADPGPQIVLRDVLVEELPGNLPARAPELKSLASRQLQLSGLLDREGEVVLGPLGFQHDLQCYPSQLYLHASVVGVAWKGGGGQLQGKPDPAPQPELLVTSSLSAAAAEGFAGGGLATLLESLLLNLPGELGTPAAQQGLAHRLHAASFASQPGGQDDAWFLEPTEGLSPTNLAKKLGFPPGTHHTLAQLPADAAAISIRSLEVRKKLVAKLANGQASLERALLRRTVFSRAEVLSLQQVPGLASSLLVFRGKTPHARHFKPSAPVVMLSGCGRAWRFGYDGRLDPTAFEDGSRAGKLKGRDGYGLLSSLTIELADIPSTPAICAGELVGAGPALSALPSMVAGLARESTLLDPSNAQLMAYLWLSRVGLSGLALSARLEEAVQAFEVETELWWGLADVEAGSELESEIVDSSHYHGTLPSPIGVTPWRQPWAPLFAEYTWAYVPDAESAKLSPAWKLGELDWEPETDFPFKPGEPLVGSERALLSIAVPDLLVGAVARTVQLEVGPNGQVQQTSAGQVARTDVLSFALAGLEPTLEKGGALRAGLLRLETLRLVDVFGQTRTLLEKGLPQQGLQLRRCAEDEKVLQQTDPLALALLRPRVAGWSRVLLRFGAEAGGVEGAARGYLLPDLVEHAVEVTDADGQGLGQLRQSRDKGQTTVRWESFPWAPVVDAGTPEDQPGRVVADGAVRVFLENLLNQPPAKNGETALSALLRVIDTTRLSVQRKETRAPGVALLTGRPVALVGATLHLETVSSRPELSEAPEPVGLRARLGSLTQLDDGLLGYVDLDAPQHFHPIDAGLLEAALSGGPYAGHQGNAGGPGGQPIKHDYLSGEVELELRVGLQKSLLLLLEPHGAVFVTTGVVPRKRLQLPEESLTGLEHLAPSFRVAPVLLRAETRALPVPTLPESRWEWVEKGEEGWTQQPLEAATGAAALDDRPAAVFEGWLRLRPDAP
jgi:hypothetical protein